MSQDYRDEFKERERDAYWTLPRAIAGVVVLVIALFVIMFISAGGDLALFKFWAPKMENAKRQVFEQTQSYVQGKVSYLTKLRLDYEGATGDQKAALRRMILTEASQVDEAKLPVDLQVFVNSLKWTAQ